MLKNLLGIPSNGHDYLLIIASLHFGKRDNNRGNNLDLEYGVYNSSSYYSVYTRADTSCLLSDIKQALRNGKANGSDIIVAIDKSDHSSNQFVFNHDENSAFTLFEKAELDFDYHEWAEAVLIPLRVKRDIEATREFLGRDRL